MAWEEEGALGHEMKSHYWEVGWLPNVLWLPHYTTLRVTHLDTSPRLQRLLIRVSDTFPLGNNVLFKQTERKLPIVPTMRVVYGCQIHSSVVGDIMRRAGNIGVKVREFVDIFCAHPPKPRQSGRRNQQNVTTPNT